MARMIPPVPALETPDSERHVYERFQSVLPDSWTVIHSQRFLLPRRGGTRAETLHRKANSIFWFWTRCGGRSASRSRVETCGGPPTVGGPRTARVKNTSSRTPRNRRVEPSMPSAGTSMTLLASGARGCVAASIGEWCYPTSSVRFDMGPELPRDVILDRSDFVQLRGKRSIACSRAGLAMGSRYPRRVPTRSWPRWSSGIRRPRGSPFSSRRRIRSSCASPKSRCAFWTASPPTDRAAIAGAAGTGKTVLAMEKARRLALRRPTRVAAVLQHAARGGTRSRRGRFRGRDVPCLLPPPRASGGAAVRAPGARPGHALLGGGGTDAVAGSPAAASLGGPVRRHRRGRGAGLPARLVAVASTRRCGATTRERSMRSTTPARTSTAAGRRARWRSWRRDWSTNCRNTARIAEYAAGLIGTEAHVKAGAPQGQPVEMVTCADGGEVVWQVAAKLEQLVLRENVDPDGIAIVSTRRLRNSPFARNHRAGCFELVNLDERGRPSSTGSRRVVFDTLHRFKGLERDVVILLDLPEGELSGIGRGAARRAVSARELSHVTASHRYVAASRARNLLIVVRLNPEPPS